MGARLMQKVVIKHYENRVIKETFEDAILTRKQRNEFQNLAIQLIEDRDPAFEVLLTNKKQNAKKTKNDHH